MIENFLNGRASVRQSKPFACSKKPASRPVFRPPAKILFHDIHLRARGHIVETEAQPWGKITHHGLPGIPSLSQADAARPAPWIGANNEEVFGGILGLSKERIEELQRAEAIK